MPVLGCCKKCDNIMLTEGVPAAKGFKGTACKLRSGDDCVCCCYYI